MIAANGSSVGKSRCCSASAQRALLIARSSACHHIKSASNVASHSPIRLSPSRFSSAVPIYFPTTFRSASLILSCQPGPAS
jgi:hypothetical protein